jgi:hypothetical protein
VGVVERAWLVSQRGLVLLERNGIRNVSLAVNVSNFYKQVSCKKKESLTAVVRVKNFALDVERLSWKGLDSLHLVINITLIVSLAQSVNKPFRAGIGQIVITNLIVNLVQKLLNRPDVIASVF